MAAYFLIVGPHADQRGSARLSPLGALKHAPAAALKAYLLYRMSIAWQGLSAEVILNKLEYAF